MVGKVLVEVESEEVACVGEGDFADHIADEVRVVGEDSLLEVVAEEIAEDAAEVFVAREREEGSGVGEHTDEAAEEAEVGEGVDLPFHAILLVEEPPS